MKKYVLFTVKKQYYKLALIYHPDRVSDEKKSKAKEDFNILHRAYNILSDADQKRAYDNGLEICLARATVSAQWESHLKVIGTDDFERARKKYQGSEKERKDMVRELKHGNGSLTHLLNNLPFMRFEDEDRVMGIIKELKKNGDLPPNMNIRKIAKKK